MHFLTTNSQNSVYNGSDPGVGKTTITLHALDQLALYPALVIAPAVVRGVWCTEIIKWCPQRTFFTIESRNALARLRTPVDFIIVSYELARTDAVTAHLATIPFRALVLDEAHRCKGLTTLQTRQILGKLWPKIPYRIALSGTPMTQSVMDLYTLFRRMDPTAFPDYYTFAATYAEADVTPWGTRYHGIKNVDALRTQIRKSFFFRYAKDDVLPELPPKLWTEIVLPRSTYADTYKTTDADRDAETAYLGALKHFYASGMHGPAPRMPVHVATLRRRLGVAKITAIADFIKNFVDTDTPLVVFFAHVEPLEKIRDTFKRYNPAVIHGATPARDRDAAVSSFQSGETALFLGNFIAAGTGITLTRASHVLLAELDYSPAVIAQAIDRLNRIGATGACTNVYYITIADTFDARVARIVADKAKTFSEVLA